MSEQLQKLIQQASDITETPDSCNNNSKNYDALEALLRAENLLAVRGKAYDAQDGATPAARERSMARTVAAFNALHGTALTEAQGWSFMLCLKLVRLFCAPGFHTDSADDAVAYAALLGEGKAREVRDGCFTG